LSEKNIKELIEVKRDNILDSVITEQWYEYVEEFIPARISSLFFFDGEKIEAFADQNKAAELLRMGIHALLGLDLVDRLTTDLLTVENKQRKAFAQLQQNYDAIRELESKVANLEDQLQAKVQEKADTQRHIALLQKSYEQLVDEYRREGGELYEQREAITNQGELAKHNLYQVEEQLRALAVGEAPLILLIDLLKETEQQAILEQQAQRNRIFYDELVQRDAAILELLNQQEVNEATHAVVKDFMAQDQGKRQTLLTVECYLNELDPLAFAPLQTQMFNQLRLSIKILREQAEKAVEEINTCERKIASIPDPERIEGITVRMQTMQKQLEQARSQLHHLDQVQKDIIASLTKQKESLLQAQETAEREKFDNEINRRVLKHAEKVRNTLGTFRLALTMKHIHRLETLILESFQQLHRKEHFVTRLAIDPTNYSLTLYTPTQEKILPETLSAGERQLLAVSILWGLSRASGRPLPAIIDTPLSRLDSKHRQNLVNNYFHQASHQVILLSTDEEISEHYYQQLKPAIGLEYSIIYDKVQQSSIIKPGYYDNRNS
jgi:DNA sulfur modification protein DndD